MLMCCLIDWVSHVPLIPGHIWCWMIHSCGAKHLRKLISCCNVMENP
ncbi:hypothetical protein MtrunA17_Chr3g0107151 [Medicago truncatula]|uniref:Uncharacterized protein n=1 Tax=Medicago truncatula TaxID=3880 RepID=A0A396ITZ1_MEDTR|nr:hypothetical protein MtrunA17_Chr3g0107151 [Medicago truncatula]